MPKKRYSDPNIPDGARCGDDLLARINELIEGLSVDECHDGNGWRYLLVACRDEIERLRDELISIAVQIENREQDRKRSIVEE